MRRSTPDARSTGRIVGKPGLAVSKRSRGLPNIQYRESSIRGVKDRVNRIKCHQRAWRCHGHFDRILRRLKLRTTGRRAGGRIGQGICVVDPPDQGCERRFRGRCRWGARLFEEIGWQVSRRWRGGRNNSGKIAIGAYGIVRRRPHDLGYNSRQVIATPDRPD